MYLKLGREISDKISDSQSENTLSIEDDPLFDFLLKHDEEIYWEWVHLYQKRRELELDKSVIKTPEKTRWKIREILKLIQRRIEVIIENNEYRDRFCSKCHMLSI